MFAMLLVSPTARLTYCRVHQRAWVASLDQWMACREPTVYGSPVTEAVCDFCTASRPVTVDEVKAAYKAAAEGPLKGILRYCEEPLVSCDFNGTSHSSILDSLLTRVMDKTFCKVLSWYDNEWGFSNRMRDVALLVGRRLT